MFKHVFVPGRDNNIFLHDLLILCPHILIRGYEIRLSALRRKRFRNNNVENRINQ